FGLTFFFMFVPVIDLVNASQSTIAAYYLIILLLYDGFYALVYSNYMALIPETFRGQDELRRFNLARLTIATLLSMVLTVILPFLRITVGDTVNMFWIGLIPGIFMPVFILLASYGTHENPAYQKTFNTKVVTSLKQAFQNKPFLGWISYHSMYNIGKYLMTSNVAILAYYSIVSGRLFGMGFESLMVPIDFIVVVAMYPLWNVLFKKVTKDWTNVVCLILAMISCLMLQFSNTIYLAIGAAALMGFAQSGYSLSHDLYNARQLDYHYSKTGQRAEGSYNGIGASINSLVNMLGPWIIVVIYAIGKHTTGTDPVDMTQSALMAVRSVSGFGAALFFGVAAILATFAFKLRGDVWKNVEAAALAKDEELKNLEQQQTAL
ncbi:MAG: MFS transporter, partial [Candidatus Omnitrophota bacterium]|nr:MFS transporter [Candidatus Omnitrophota bacterium]